MEKTLVPNTPPVDRFRDTYKEADGRGRGEMMGGVRGLLCNSSNAMTMVYS